MLYLRNIKRGFATNSSSYHTTIDAWIDVPQDVYNDFKEQHENYGEDTTNGSGYGGYRKYDGITLVDDYDNEYKVYQDILEAAHGSIEIVELDGNMIRLKFSRDSED